MDLVNLKTLSRVVVCVVGRELSQGESSQPVSVQGLTVRRRSQRKTGQHSQQGRTGERVLHS